MFPNSFVPRVAPALVFKYYPMPGFLYYFFPLFFGYFVIYGVCILWKELTLSPSPLRQNQIKYLLAGVIVGFTGGSTTFLPVFGIKIHPYGTYCVTFYVLTVAYAIIQHRLMGIEVLLKRGFWLAVSFTAALASGYGLFTVFENTLQTSARVNAALSSTGMLLTFSLLLWRIYITQFRPADLKVNALKEASLEMVIFPNPERLSKEVCNRVFLTFNPTFAHIYLIGQDKVKYDLQNLMGESEGPLKKRLTKKDSIVKWFLDTAPLLAKKELITQKQAKILVYNDIAEKWMQNPDFLKADKHIISILSGVKKQMEELKAEFVVASSYKRKLYGFLILGEKASGFYTPEDLEVLSSLSTIAAMNIRNALTVYDLHAKVRDKTRLLKEMRNRTTQMVLAFNKSIDARYPYMAERSRDIKEVGLWIAKEMKLEITDRLIFALQLHDIGKIGLPDEVIYGEGKLNKNDYNKLIKHPKISRDILNIMDSLKEVAEIAYCHQERYDGQGYPRGLKDEEIPIEARIIAVADAYYRAMASDKPDKEAIPMKNVARDLLKERGKQFDPNAIDALVRRMIKARNITRKQVKHIAIEEGLVPFGDIDLFLKNLLNNKNS